MCGCCYPTRICPTCHGSGRVRDYYAPYWPWRPYWWGGATTYPVPFYGNALADATRARA